MSDYEFWDELGKIFNAVLAYQEKTIEFNKRFINPWIRLGNVFDRQDHNRDAIRAYQKAIEIDPDNAQNWYELGNVYFRSGAFEEAVQAFNKAIEMNPDLGWSFSNLALTLVTQGKYSEAVPLYMKSIDLLTEDKDKAVAWNRLGNVYRKLNEYERAVEAFQKADELDAENAGFRDELDEAPTGISLAVEVPNKGRDQASELPPSILQLVVEESQTEKTVASSSPAEEPKTRPISAATEKPTSDESQPTKIEAGKAASVPPTDVVPDQDQTPIKLVEDTPSGTDSASLTSVVSSKTTDASVPEAVPAQAAPTGNSTPSDVVVQPADATSTADDAAQAKSANQSVEPVVEADQTLTVVVQNTVETYTEYTAVVNSSSETSDVVPTAGDAPSEPIAQVEEKPVSTPEEKPEPPQPAQATAKEATNKATTPDEPVAKDKVEVKQETEVVIVEEVTTIEETIEEPANQATDAGLATGQVAYEEFLKDSVETINLMSVQPVAENNEKPGPITQQEPATRVNAAGELQIEMDTKNAHVWNELGNVYFNSCAYDDAIVAYSKAIELDRWFAWPYSNLALAYVQKGRFAEAILLYQRSIELFSSDKDKAISWNRLGNVYRRLNDYDNAISAYQRADEMDPDNSTLSLQSRFSLLGAYASDQKPNYVL